LFRACLNILRFSIFAVLWALIITPALAVEVQLVFTNGGIGGIGNNQQQANSVVSFGGLDITSATLTQDTDDGRFGGTQGNDFDATLTLETSGSTITIPAFIGWRIGANPIDAVGIAPDAGWAGATIVPSTGSVELTEKSNFVLFLNSSSYSYTDGDDLSGNAANSGIFTELNSYLVSDSGGYLLSKTALEVSETGTSATFEVVLTTPPASGNVVFDITASDTGGADNDDPGEADSDVATLTFNSNNWNIAQTVTITGLDDTFRDGKIASTVTVAINTLGTSDSNFNALPSQSVAIDTLDDESDQIDLVTSMVLTSGDGTPEIGDTVTFTITVENKGSVDASNVVLTDSLPGGLTAIGNNGTVSAGGYSAGTWTVGTLVAGGSVTLIIEGTVDGDQAGLTITNSTTAARADESDPDVTKADLSQSVTVLAPGTPELTVTKTVNETGLSSPVVAGDTLAYTVTIANSGTVALYDIAVSDALTANDGRTEALTLTGDGLSDSGTPGDSFDTTTPGGVYDVLAPGDALSYVVTYTLLQSDIDAGGMSNLATATASTSAGGATDVTVQSSATGNVDASGSGTTTTLGSAASVAILKAAVLNDPDANGASVGDSISYTFTVQNTGNVTLRNITLSDQKPGVSASDDPISSLAPGASDSATFSATYTITQVDIDAGTFSNQALVTATLPDGTVTVTDTSGTTLDNNTATKTTLSSAAAITFVKTAVLNDDDGTNGVSVGDSISYTFDVTNSGNVTLENVVLSETSFSGSGGPIAFGALLSGDDNSDSKLSVGETWRYEASYLITAADFDLGIIDNQASVTADLPNLAGTVSAESRPSLSAEAGATTTFLGGVSGDVSDGGVGEAGVTVILLVDGTEIARTVTDADGKYSFVNLIAGTYSVQFDGSQSLQGYDGEDKGAEGATDGVTQIAIAYGTDDQRNFYDISAISIDPSGVIYDALTRAPLAGATVTLYYEGAEVSDTWLDTTNGDANNKVTGADGIYAFLLQSPAASGTYSLAVAQDGFSTDSTMIPPKSGAYTPAIGAGVEEIVATSGAPALGDDTTYYLEFEFTFTDWMVPATLSKGVVNNNIPLDPEGALIPQIEDELKSILEDDLKETIKRQAQQFTRLSYGALSRLKAGQADGVWCGTIEPKDINGQVDVSHNSAVIDLNSFEKVYDCVEGEWIIRTKELAYSSIEGTGLQWSASFLEAREKFDSEDDLRGWFWGAYVSRTRVNDATSATGSITGFGLNGGIYGASRLDEDLYLDYFAAAAAGLHTYDMVFERAYDINATGSYSYLAGFAGAALSGESRVEDWIISPRLSVNMAYALAGQVDVQAEYVGLTDTGSLTLSDQSQLRLGGEVIFGNDTRLYDDGEGFWDTLKGRIAIAPRYFCDTSFGAGLVDCGYGGYVEWTDTSFDERETLSYRIDAERQGDGDIAASLALSRRWLFDDGNGSVVSTMNAADSGTVTLGSELNWEF
jgi:uncharacterized repeat protein (TIGR01451 family)